jgi:RNA polymerase sigma-70 factor (ECF subfamily)
MTGEPASIRDALVEEIPSLRAFAASLSRNMSEADDLVQETLLKAIKSADSFKEGTNLRAWLFTILRNTFYSTYRKRKRETLDGDGYHESRLVSPASQLDHLHFQDMRAALNQLPFEQREALILVGASGMSYEEAAEICGCALGTVKSRVNRARVRLAELLDVEPDEGIGGDKITTAVVGANVGGAFN